MTWIITILRRVWGYAAIAGAVLAALLWLRMDASRDAQQEMRRLAAERQNEAVKEAKDATNTVHHADPNERRRLRDRWTRHP